MKHKHPPVRHRSMRGAFSLGMLQAVVNSGQSAKRRLSWDKQMSEADRKEHLRRIWDAEGAKASMEEILESSGFYDVTIGLKLREIRNQSFDEMLRGEVQVEVYYSPSCPRCKGVLEKIQGISQPQGFKTKLMAVDESPPGKEWALESWPHIEVNGHEITIEMLEDLAVDAGWIRALDQRRGGRLDG